MKQVIAGIVAHVDAGKTTLSEALLYKAGEINTLGRVDNENVFLDNETLERQRGITIFSHQANLKYQDLTLTLLDTPGHLDFVDQTEQVLSVLDYAILVVSATDGVQGHTKTLWNLLERYQVPTIIFVNKMDIEGTNEAKIMAQLRDNLAAGCIQFNSANKDQTNDNISQTAMEELALIDETLLSQFLDDGRIKDEDVQRLVLNRQVVPCYFGTALKLTGVDDLLSGLAKLTQESAHPEEFGAKVFKISHDSKGERLTWIKLTGGTLKIKDVILDNQKVNQLRIYNGEKYQLVKEVVAGTVCTIPGLTDTYPGQGLGLEPNTVTPIMQPVLNYALDPKENDIYDCLQVVNNLAEENPLLNINWSEQLQEIRIQVMGQIQIEVLKQLFQEKFGMDVDFIKGQIVYQETITKAIEGVGHFEPLRHYAEVHLLMEPLTRGSGIQLATNCSPDLLGKNWQHQVITSLQSKTHLGVLTGSPITDIKITLISGRASIKHSVGGDFREATYRAVRQGLMELMTTDNCQLLEPWYRFNLVVPVKNVGKAINDIQLMNGNFEIDDDKSTDTLTTITGEAPVAQMQDYYQTVLAYTHGKGQLDCLVSGYKNCSEQESIIAAANYNPVADLANTPDSVFCAKGAGYPVKWDQVPQTAHVEYQY